jgi:hypothetical protein
MISFAFRSFSRELNGRTRTATLTASAIADENQTETLTETGFEGVVSRREIPYCRLENTLLEFYLGGGNKFQFPVAVQIFQQRIHVRTMVRTYFIRRADPVRSGPEAQHVERERQAGCMVAHPDGQVLFVGLGSSWPTCAGCAVCCQYSSDCFPPKRRTRADSSPLGLSARTQDQGK